MMEDYKELIEILRDDEFCGILDYIDDAADAIEQLVKERKTLKRNFATVVKDCDKLVKERDAAVADLKNNGDCSFCKHEQVPIDNEPCNSCMYNGYESNFSNFEWRGVQEDNDEID